MREEYNDTIQADHVIRQDVERDTQILAGSTVVIHVSLGIQQVTVPNLANRTEQEAINLINESGLRHRTTVRVRDTTRPNGVVVDQSINTGTVVDRGTEIEITVNEFDELHLATVTVNVRSLLGYTPNPEEPSERVSLQIRVNNIPVGARTVARDSASEIFTFQDRGIVEITVFVDGVRLPITRSLNLNQTTAITIY